MEQKQHIINYTVYNSITELAATDKLLLETAQQYTENAYAPYSNFHVAATALLSNGELVSGTNQENASYPVTICAERTLLGTIASMFPNEKINAMAISYDNKNTNSNSIPATPCGMCRQALAEWITRQQQGFKLILGGQDGEVLVFENAKDILPFGFDKAMLK